MIAKRLKAWFRTAVGASKFLPLAVLAALPSAVSANVTANLTWTASPGTNVTGYNLYYGNASHQYSNSISVGNVTTADIPNLLENTAYFFAAKAHDSTGIGAPRTPNEVPKAVV